MERSSSVSSIAGLQGSPTLGVYRAAQAADVQLVRNLAVRCAICEHGRDAVMSTVESKSRALRTGRVDLPGGVGRAVLVAALMLGTAAGVLATGTDASAQAVAAAGVELTRLLRAMAGLKMLLAVAAMAGMWWRLGCGAGAGWLAAYAVACGAMAAGPVLIWGMVHVEAGALALHGGLAVGLVVLWRDPVVGARLASMVTRRRARSR